MKISFSSLGDPDRPLEELAHLLELNGYDAIELRGRPGKHVHWQDGPDRRAEVRKILADHGLEPAAVTTYVLAANRESGGPDRPDHRSERENIEELKRWVDLASELGAPNIRIFGGALPADETHEDAMPRVARIMDAAAAVNPEVNLCLETHDVWNTGEIVSWVLDNTERENCKAVWDVGGSWPEETPDQTLGRLRPDRVAYLHLGDYFDVPGHEGKYHCFMGAGEIPLRRIIRLLRGVGWEGYLDVEWEGVYNDYMPQVEVGIAQGARKLREYLKE